jgi:uncharacterized peroxidase-related enzyme
MLENGPLAHRPAGRRHSQSARDNSSEENSMTRIPALRKDEVDPILQGAMDKQEGQLGLVPESLLTMAYKPRMAAAWANLTAEIVGDGVVDRGLKQLVAYVASATHGCRYCQAHTGHAAQRNGVDVEKVQAAFEYETSELFTDAERAALSLAHNAALVPNGVTDEHFDQLKEHFTNEQIVEIMSVIAMFGWLNRWNDTMATTLENHPLHWAQDNLADGGWSVGRHARETREET